jgi:hypothetical protein
VNKIISIEFFLGNVVFEVKDAVLNAKDTLKSSNID